MSTVYNPKMTRRESLKRMGSMTSVVMIGGIAVACEAPEPEAMAVDASSHWPDLDFAAISENGYGTDPNMISPTAPWPRTLSPAQLDQVAVLSDIICPRDERGPFCYRSRGAGCYRRMGERALLFTASRSRANSKRTAMAGR